MVGTVNKRKSEEASPDQLLPEEIKSWLPPDYPGEVFHYPAVSSTNDIAKQLGASFASGTIVVAEVQTGGKGRLGRGWESPAGGIWFSLLLRPRVGVFQTPLVALMAAVVVAGVLRETCGVEAGIKWPNDILVGGRKLCGILTELSAELGRVNYLVVGIGINANFRLKAISPQLRPVVTTLLEITGHKVNRGKLVADIAGSLKSQLDGPHLFAQVRQRWRQLSVTIGRRVEVRSHGEMVIGRAVDISEDGALIVEDDAKRRHVFRAGEVTLG